jgi:hypothetical protein
MVFCLGRAVDFVKWKQFWGGINEVSNRIMSVPDYFDIRQLGELLNQNIWTSLAPTYSAS